jgi:multicomponent Na+:H+ antiporter subunit D
LLILLVRRRGGRVSYSIAVASAVVSTGAAVAGLRAVISSGTIRYQVGGWAPPIGIELVLDPLSAFLSVVIMSVALLVLIHSGRVVAQELPEKAAPFYSLALLLLGGLLGITITGDLFNLYVFLEISSLASYALLSIGDKRAPVSAFRYLILGSVGASFYLLGLGFMFMVTGSLNMADVASILPHVAGNEALLVGLVLMTLGLAVKMALFPMHGWLPDAYTYASSTATALIAPIGTKVAAYVLIRLFFYVLEPEFARGEIALTAVIGYLGAAGVIWGSLLALAQSDLKRMLAYSSVGQIGYIALGIGLASPLGLIGAVLHTLNHAVMKGCLFLVSANFLTRLGHSNLDKLDDSTRLRMPWTAAAFTVAAISMIGLPPTAGFFSKWYLVLGSVEKSNWVFVTAIMLSSLLNAVYFFRVIERIYLRRHAGSGIGMGSANIDGAYAAARQEVAGSMLIPTLVLAVALLVLGIFNVWIVNSFINPMIPVEL